MSTSLPQVARILALTDESPEVRTLVLDLSFAAEPGQFVMAWLPGVDEKPFSLVRANPVTLTIARVGPFTTSVFTLDIGHRLWLRGPFGRPFTLPASPIPNTQYPLLLVAGGYGVAPLYFLAERALAAGWPLSVVVGARTAQDVIFEDRFSALGAQVAVTTDDGSAGERGVATDVGGRLLDRGEYRAIYACGPEPMLEAVQVLARRHKLPAQLSYERTMRCGFGVCGTCTRQGWLVCHDGPVREVRSRR
jgi:dihydroorotate dehydrogenase electron transfer subunit